MLTILNIISLAVILVPAAYYGWLGETIQYKLLKFGPINEQYDRELLLAIALVQAGKADAGLDSDGMIRIHMGGENQLTIYAQDYRDENFGSCYRCRKDGYTQRREGIISLSTRKYLRNFKEEYFGVRDPSSIQKPLFNFKKEKVTIK